MGLHLLCLEIVTVGVWETSGGWWELREVVFLPRGVTAGRGPGLPRWTQIRPFWRVLLLPCCLQSASQTSQDGGYESQLLWGRFQNACLQSTVVGTAMAGESGAGPSLPFDAATVT